MIYSFLFGLIEFIYFIIVINEFMNIIIHIALIIMCYKGSTSLVYLQRYDKDLSIATVSFCSGKYLSLELLNIVFVRLAYMFEER